MTWARYDDELPMNHKIARLVASGQVGVAAIGLHVLANTWSRHQGTGGAIPGYQPGVLVADARLGRKLAEALADVGMFDACEDGWMIHDFDEFSDPDDDGASAAEKRRRLSEVRAVAGRKGGQASSSKRGSKPQANGEQCSSPGPDPVGTTGSTERPDDSTCPPRSSSVSPQRIKATAKALAGLQWAQRDEAGLVDRGKRTGWVGVTHRGILDERSDEIVHLLTQGLDPDAAAQQMHAPKLTLVVNKPDVPMVVCPACEGAQNVNPGTGYVQCPECRGAGKVPESIDLSLASGGTPT